MSKELAAPTTVSSVRFIQAGRLHPISIQTQQIIEIECAVSFKQGHQLGLGVTGGGSVGQCDKNNLLHGSGVRWLHFEVFIVPSRSNLHF